MPKRKKRTKTFAIQPTPCPICHSSLDRATSINHVDHPVPGDITGCLNCGAVLVFDEELVLRRATPKELLNFQLSSEWPAFERVMRGLRARMEIAGKTKPPK